MITITSCQSWFSRRQEVYTEVGWFKKKIGPNERTFFPSNHWSSQSRHYATQIYTVLSKMRAVKLYVLFFISSLTWWNIFLHDQADGRTCLLWNYIFKFDQSASIFRLLKFHGIFSGCIFFPCRTTFCIVFIFVWVL